MKHHPLLDRVLILRDPTPVMHPISGLRLPESAREDYRPNTGTVAAVGPGLRDQTGHLHPVGFAPGAKVLFGGAAGTCVEHDGAEHLLMNEPNVLSVLSAN